MHIEDARDDGHNADQHDQPAVLADPASNRPVLRDQLEDLARRTEDGEAEGLPYLVLAARLRALASQRTDPLPPEQ